MHRSISVLAASLIGVVTAVMLLCAFVLFIRFGGDDDGTSAAVDVADALKAAVGRNDQGQLTVRQTQRLEDFAREFPSFWYVVSDRTGEASFGPVPKWRPPKGTAGQEGTRFIAFAIDGDTRSLRKLAATRSTSVGEVWIETGGVAYSATQLMIGALTDATMVALPILVVLVVTAFAALVFVPALIARPVRSVARAAEMIDGVPRGRRLPEEGTPAELLPLVNAFNRALARIDAASSAQRNFLSNVAHELRTPLTNVRTSLDQIQDPVLRAKLVGESQRLSSIVTMLFQLARLSADPAEFTELDLVALARRVAAEHAPMALKAGCEIAFADPGSPVSVRGSETAIGVALSNLIRNAVLHAESSDPILVKVTAPARVSVIDSGRGLQIGQPEHIFEAFRRGSTRSEGVGLGLSIVLQVMTMHLGEIAIHATPGGGTTVELNFPPEQTRAISATPEPARIRRMTAGMRGWALFKSAPRKVASLGSSAESTELGQG